MRYGELTRKLRRQGKGSHEIWWDPKLKLYTLIPNHPDREIKKRTLASILEDLGLKEGDLEGL